MSTTVNFSALRELSDEDRALALGRLVMEARGPRNGNFQRALDEISAFEIRFRMSSSELLEALRLGKIEENLVIGRWLYLIQLTGASR